MHFYYWWQCLTHFADLGSSIYGPVPWLLIFLDSILGIDLENIVYYKDDTHYFVMTAKKQSLLDKGVILHVSVLIETSVIPGQGSHWP